MIKGGRVATPRVTNDILEPVGITRDTLMVLFRNEQSVDVVEREIDRTELYLADEREIVSFAAAAWRSVPCFRSTGIKSATEDPEN